MVEDTGELNTFENNTDSEETLELVKAAGFSKESTRRRFLGEFVDFVGKMAAAGVGVEALAACGTTIEREDETKSEVLKTGSIEFGFNTHIRSENEEGQVLTPETFNNIVDLIAGKGMKWIRFDVQPDDFVILREVEGGKRESSWGDWGVERYREAMEYASERGLKVAISTSMPGYTKDLPEDEYLDTAREYYSRLGKEFGDVVDVWQIFNEADVHRFRDYGEVKWDDGGEYVRQFGRVVKVATEALRESGVSGEMTVNVSWWQGRPDRKTTSEAIFDEVAAYIDVLTFDLYPDTNIQEISKLPEYMEEFSKKYGKPVTVGEIGLPAGEGAFSEEEQAWAIKETIEALKGGNVLPQAILIYEIMDDPMAGGGNREKQFGLFYANGKPKSSAAEVMGAMSSDEKEDE